MPQVSDLVHETAATTGTGNFTVAAVNGRRRFSTAFGTGGTDVFDYFISNRDAAEWERGTGHMSDSNTLVRDTVLGSSNSNSAVSFSAGTKDVTSDVPAGVRVRSDTTQNLLVGYTFTAFNAGTKSSGTFTPDGQVHNHQYATNNGAHTLAAPSADCDIDILYTNGASAGAITFSGFTVGSNTGDALTTTNTHKFLISIRRINSVATYSIRALQ